jgi:hypothetical protein
MVHSVCNSQLIALEGKTTIFCEVCNREVKTAEILEVDDSPSPFSG